MNYGFVPLMDNILMLLVNIWLMNLSNLLFDYDRLMMLIDYRLMMLMNHILMMLVKHILMMLMKHITMSLFHNCGS